MADINIQNFLNNALHRQKLINTQNTSAKQTFSQPSAVQNIQANPQPKIVTPEPQVNQNLQMNTLKSIDRAIYAKDVMGMPKNINEFVYMVQRGMNQTQFNQMFSSQLAAQRNSLSQLQAQILAQLQGFDTESMQALVNKQLTTQLQSALKNLEILPNGMINLSQISQMLQINGKDAIAKIIMSMTEASKMGITDLAQMKDMAKLINASVAIAAENDSAKTLKLLLMLYLPWFPLKEGVDFDLDVETKTGGKENDSIFTITITTVNFGMIVVTLYLETSNSVQLVVECSDKFPKEELQIRLEGDKKHYSMDTVTTFSVKKDTKPQAQERAKANINMSQTFEINPYLLLSAHSVIKHVIDIDNNASIGVISHPDYS